YTKLQATYNAMTVPVPSARESGRLRLGLITSPAVKVTLFQASAENRDPTWATATRVSAPASVGVAPWRSRQKFAPKFAATATAFRPSTMPTKIRPSSAATFAEVKAF